MYDNSCLKVDIEIYIYLYLVLYYDISKLPLNLSQTYNMLYH